MRHFSNQTFKSDRFFRLETFLPDFFYGSRTSNSFAQPIEMAGRSGPVPLQEYEVESVLAERKSESDGSAEFLIKWKDFPPSFNSWEPVRRDQEGAFKRVPRSSPILPSLERARSGSSRIFPLRSG